MDRRETGLFPGKTKTSLSVSFFSKMFLSLFTWVKQLLRGMRRSFKKPAKCVKELHSPEQQHASKHWLFIKLCWLMEKHAAQGRPRSEAGPAVGHNAKEATTFTVAFSMDRGPLDMLIEQAAKTDAVLPEERTHHVTSENVWTVTATTILQFTATLDNVLNPSKGEAWILLCDTASIHASEVTMTSMKEKFPHVIMCFLSPRSTSQAWTTGWRPLRAHSDAQFQRSRRRGRGTPFPRRPLRQAHRARARSRRPCGLGHGRGVRRRGRRAHGQTRRLSLR